MKKDLLVWDLETISQDIQSAQGNVDLDDEVVYKYLDDALLLLYRAQKHLER